MQKRSVIVSIPLFMLLLAGLPVAAAFAEKPCPDTAGFIIIGEAEKVMLLAKDLRLDARIDTGATTSSIGAVDPQLFERDGEKWVRFSVRNPKTGQLVEFKRRLTRNVEIKRHGAASQVRPVVKLKIRLGSVEMEREFSLADRSRFTYPVLIGRNVLRGQFLVDVNRKYTSQRSGGKEE